MKRCRHKPRKLMLESLENRQLLTVAIVGATSSPGCACPVCGQWVEPEDNTASLLSSSNLAASRASVASLTASPGVSFRDDAAVAGLAGSNPGFSISWIDYDNDGDLDLWLGRAHWSEDPNEPGVVRPPPQLMRNNGFGVFTNVFGTVFSDGIPGDTHGSTWTDLDNDGDADFIQTVGGDRGLTRETELHRHRVYLQDKGKLTLAPASLGLAQPLGRGREVEAFDANRDGLLDLFFSNSPRQGSIANSELYLADARGYQTLGQPTNLDFTGEELITSQYNDITGDGRPDLVSLDSAGLLQVHEIRGTNLPQDIVARNDLIPASPMVAAIRDFAIADFNGDGKNDLLVSRREGAVGRTELYLFDTATQKFRDATANSDIGAIHNGASIAVGDFDNDRDLDFYLSRENGSYDDRDKIFYNRGNATFENEFIDATAGKTFVDHGLGRKVIAGDYNNDGFLDLFVGSTKADGNQAKLHRNLKNSNHWITLNLEGVVSAREAIGARVEVTAGGETQVAFQTTGKHHFAQNDSRLHFGLGNAKTVSQIKITWPSGRVKILKNIAGDRMLTIREAENNIRGNAPRIVVSGTGTMYPVKLTPTNTQAYYRFTAGPSGTLQLSKLPAGISLQIENSTGTVLHEFASGTKPSVALGASTYFLHFTKAVSPANVNYAMVPTWKVVDTFGPAIEEPVLDDTASATMRTIEAIVSDARNGNAAIAAVKYWIDVAGDPATTGTNLTPVDGGAFNSSIEYVSAAIPIATYAALTPGEHTLYLQAQDQLGNWGLAHSVPFVKQESAAPNLIGLPANVTESKTNHTLLMPNATVFDADTTSFLGAEITVRLNGARGGDRLDLAFDSVITQSPYSYRADRILYQGREIASYFGGWREDTFGTPFYFHPLTIRFVEDVSAEVVALVLQRIEFWNDSATTSVPDRTLDILFHDGHGGRTSSVVNLKYSV